MINCCGLLRIVDTGRWLLGLIVEIRGSHYRSYLQLEARHLIGMKLVCLRPLEVKRHPWLLTDS